MQEIIHITVRVSFSFVLILFGLNHFFYFLPDPGYGAEAQALVRAFRNSGYIFYAVGAVQIAFGITLLINQYIPLGLLLFTPILVNVLLFHLCVDIVGLPKTLPILLLYTYYIFRYKSLFSSLFKSLSL